MTAKPDRQITRADVLTAVEVATLLDMKEGTVADWARQGRIPSRKRGKRRFFLRWEVEGWLIAED